MSHIEVTDEMVDRAVEYLHEHFDDYDTGGGWLETPADEIETIINIKELLDAALNGEKK